MYIKLRHDITFSLLITQFRLSDVLFIVFIIVMKKNYILTFPSLKWYLLMLVLRIVISNYKDLMIYFLINMIFFNR